jgi:hypothetical protein
MEFPQLPNGPVEEFTKDIKQKKLTVKKILRKNIIGRAPNPCCYSRLYSLG